MCGIFCIFSNSTETDTSKRLFEKYITCKFHIGRRGPDAEKNECFTLNDYTFLCAASVLWLQGETVTLQPAKTQNSFFLYNGDLFGDEEASRKKLGDTWLFQSLLDESDDLISVLSNLQGPYAFIYLDYRTLKLYFCRDFYGRRSLLIAKNEEDFLLSSVASRNLDLPCCELPPLGLFCYDLNTKTLELNPFPFQHSNFESKLNELISTLKIEINVVVSQNLQQTRTFFDPCANDLHLFKYSKDSNWSEFFDYLLNDKVWFERVSSLHKILESAIKSRVSLIPKFCKNCILEQLPCQHSTIGVLFSGGVDCAILALIVDKYVDENATIDLLNVTFTPNAPDRLSGLETLKELQNLRPNRYWNFVEIDVTKDELNYERKTRIADLIYPLNTILDDSLGCALWFASRGQNATYKSPCRVVLVGMGADELFGGYTKHRAAFRRGGWSSLNQSLEEDWQNISHRNLARDDRVISDHGRQLRTPYLDENLVEFVRSLNCWERTCPSNDLPQGIGEKILLRSLAYHLGLRNAAGLKKRALQFGSRIANSKENANHISPRLL